MARVVRKAASAAAWRAPSRAIERRARKHKVVMESVTREKKKLRSMVSTLAVAVAVDLALQLLLVRKEA